MCGWLLCPPNNRKTRQLQGGAEEAVEAVEAVETVEAIKAMGEGRGVM